MMSQWLEDVSICLRGVAQEHLDRAADILDVKDEDWLGFENKRPAAIAHQLLHSNLKTALDALRQLTKSLNMDITQKLVDWIIPVWVSEAAARNINPVLGRPNLTERNIAINARMQRTGEHFIMRALCCSKAIHTITTSEISGSLEEIEARYDTEVMKVSGYWDEASPWQVEEPIESCLDLIRKSPDPWFLIFGPDAIRLGAPERLREKYRGMTFVLLCGDQVPRCVESKLPNLELIQPALQKGEETQSLFFTRQIEMLGDQRLRNRS